MRALALEPRNGQAHYCLGLVLLFSRRPEEAIAELERAVALNPNLAFAHAQIGFAKYVVGRAEETEAHVREALRLSPRDNGVYLWFDFLAVAKILLGQDEAAVRWGRMSVESNRGYPMAHFHYGAALALCGRIADAEAQTRAGLDLSPEFTIRSYREDALGENPAYLLQRERVLEGLRLAGAPEG